ASCGRPADRQVRVASSWFPSLARISLRLVHKHRRTTGMFPSPLWGGVRGGGQWFWAQCVNNCHPPSPTLPHKAGGSRPVVRRGRASISSKYALRLRGVHAHQVRDLGDHPADLRRIGTLDDAPDAVEPEPDQRLALTMMAADRAAGLLNLDHFSAVAH